MRTRWRAERLDEFRRLAARGIGGPAIASHYGVSLDTVHSIAKRHHIKILSARQRPELTSESALRKHWSEIIGPMKAALRAEVEAISQGQ